MNFKFIALTVFVGIGAAASLIIPSPSARAQDAKPAAAAAAPAPPGTLKDQKSQIGYTIGFNLGSSLKRDEVDVDPQLIAQGVRDALNGAKPQLTPEMMAAVIGDLRQAVTTRKAQQAAKAAADNAAAGAAFLKANAAKPGVVTLPSGLQYEVLTAGKGPKPKADDTVSCNYRGTLIDGTEFDSSYARGAPASLQVQGLIKGWTEALQMMPVGSKWRLVVPPSLAYGEAGAGDKIGPNATLVFELELLGIEARD